MILASAGKPAFLVDLLVIGGGGGGGAGEAGWSGGGGGAGRYYYTTNISTLQLQTNYTGNQRNCQSIVYEHFIKYFAHLFRQCGDYTY